MSEVLELRLQRASVPMTEAGDEALVERVAAGSSAAFEALFERYRDRIFQFVLWQLDTGRDSAEELTQEIFFQLYRSASTFRHRSSFRTWLYSLARNVCRHHERKHRRETAEAVPDLAGDGSDALDRLTAAEDRARVRKAVAALPREQRSALLLRDWEDLSYQEIAVVLDIPVGTVRSRLHNARCALAHALSARPSPITSRSLLPPLPAWERRAGEVRAGQGEGRATDPDVRAAPKVRAEEEDRRGL